MDSIDIARRYSKATDARLLAMQCALETLDQNNINGDVVECGVWRGGHIILTRLVSPQRTCWLYDTFEGMTKPGPFDLKNSGAPPPKKALNHKWTMASLSEVQQNLVDTGTWDDDKLIFIVGDVSQTLRLPANLPDTIALLRLDTDWYESTKIELEMLFPRLTKGGVLIVDDYGHWMGARKAVNEYLGHRAKGLQSIDYTAVMFIVS